MSVRSVAVPFSPYRLSCQGNIVINCCCYQSSPLSSGYEHTQVYRHTRTYNNTHDRMVGSRHTQVRCGERSKSKSLYLIAQQSGVECSAYFEHVQIRCFFFFSLCPFIFRFSSVLCSPFFFSAVGSQSRETQKRKEEKMKSIEKRGGDKKKKSSLIFWFWSWDFSALYFFFLSPLSADAPLLAVAVVVAFVPRVSAHV